MSPSSKSYLSKTTEFCRRRALHISADMLAHLSDVLDTLYWNADNMHALYCFLRKLFETSPPSSSYYMQYDRATQIIRQSTHIGAGEQGNVFLVRIKDLFFMILKCAPVDREDLAHEFAIGSLGTNRLRHYLPNFAYIFPIYREGGHECLFIERIRGKTWNEAVIKAPRVDPLSFLRLWAQILCALEIAQDRIGFCHFDLHRYNVMVREGTEARDYVYVMACREYKILGMREIATFIDYGHSCIRYRGRYLGMGEHPQHGMVDFMVPGQDLFRFSSNTWCRGCADPKIQAFFDLLMTDFYGIPCPAEDHRHRLCREWGFPNSIAVSDYASYTPAMLLRWFLTKREPISALMGIHANDFPVRESPRTRFRTAPASPSIFPQEDLGQRYRSCLGKYPSVRKDPTMQRYLRRLFLPGAAEEPPVAFRYPETIDLPRMPTGSTLPFPSQPYQADPASIRAFRASYSAPEILCFKKKVERLLDAYYRSTESRVESARNPHAAFLTKPYVRFFCQHIVRINRLLRYEDFLRESRIA